MVANIQGETLIQYSKHVNENVSTQILDFCRHIAGSSEITAASLCGGCTLGVLETYTTIEVLLVIRDFQPRLMNYVKVVDERNVVVFAVDKWVFERDVERGFLGEALAGVLIFPYITLLNENYLHVQEVKLKKRLALELLENIVLSFPELSYEIHIEPQYFMYEAMLNRVRVFPPLAYSLSNFMHGSEREKKAEFVLRGYLEALKQLETEGKIEVSKGYVRIPKKFVEENRNPRVRFINISKSAPRTLFTSLLAIFPQMLNFFSQNTEAFLRFQNSTSKRERDVNRHLADPQKYLYVPTARGLISLAEKMDIEAFARKVLSAGKGSKVEIEEIGGVLNDVYLIKTFSDSTEKKALVKRFKDWSSFKWFPLTLWSIGARTFTVLGRSRLERECAINEVLLSQGFNVPKILFVSHNERLLFMEYIEGESLDKAIKRIAKLRSKDKVEKELNILMKVGEIFAKIHAINVSLGDTKPENVMVDKNGEVYFLDFEQASRSGDKVWDVAEFLYYSGHYLPPLYGNRQAELIAKAFVSGYLNAGGDINVIKKAGNAKYTRVFSVFTFPLIMFAISNVCRNTETVR